MSQHSKAQQKECQNRRNIVNAFDFRKYLIMGQEPEKDLYPAVQKFLKTEKKCLPEYVGTEISLKRGKTSLRVDVFGVSNRDEKIIYFCEGKKELKQRSFGKVVGEAIGLLKYANYVYVFGSTESFEAEESQSRQVVSILVHDS